MKPLRGLQHSEQLKLEIKGFVILEVDENKRFGRLDDIRKRSMRGTYFKRPELPQLVQSRRDSRISNFVIQVEKKALQSRCPAVEVKRKSIIKAPEERPRTSPGKKALVFSKTKSLSPPKPEPMKVKVAQSATQLLRIPENQETWRKRLGMPDKKVICLVGTYPSVRAAFSQRDWVEHSEPHKMNFDLLWTRKSKVPDNLKPWQIINHFERNFELCTKAHLGGNLNKLVSMFNVNPRNFYPRTYRINEKLPDDFLDKFKLSFALGLLKHFVEGTKEVPIEMVLTAALVCNRWAADLENSKREEKTGLVMNLEWRLLTSQNPSEIEYLYRKIIIPMRSTNDEEVKQIASNVLRRLRSADSQFFLNGKQGIWIVKHGFKSRGRDIILQDNLESIRQITENSNSWIIQKYIENPLIIQDRKFDIRQWVLVTNADPLVAYIYKDSYLRFSAEQWNLGEIKNKFIHLTNNSVSKNSKHFSSSEIEGCMWHIDTFKQYLRNQFGRNAWEESLFPRIKKIIRWSLQSVGRLGYRKGNTFEVFGYDFMIDDNLTPWLLEINSSPSMDYSTAITEKLVKAMLTDTVKLVVDHDFNGNFLPLINK